MKRTLVALVTVVLVGCATARPILYSNEKYQQVGRSGADRDIAECRKLADQAGATPGAGKAGQVAKGAGVGAVGGAAAGVVGGAIAGSPSVGAAAGAASGVVWSLFWSMFGWMRPSQPSDVHMNYVNASPIAGTRWQAGSRAGARGNATLWNETQTGVPWSTRRESLAMRCPRP